MMRSQRSGLPIAGGTMQGNILFSADNTHNIGSASLRPANIYVGTGIYIGGTTSANLLTDYEEGTFTVAVTTAGGGETVTYDSRSGIYTKTGRAVAVYGAFDLATFSGGSSTVRVSLPFTAANAFMPLPVSGQSGFGTAPGVVQTNNSATTGSLLALSNLNSGIDATAMSGDEEMRYGGTFQTA